MSEGRIASLGQDFLKPSKIVHVFVQPCEIHARFLVFLIKHSHAQPVKNSLLQPVHAARVSQDFQKEKRTFWKIRYHRMQKIYYCSSKPESKHFFFLRIRQIIFLQTLIAMLRASYLIILKPWPKITFRFSRLKGDLQKQASRRS